MTENERKTEKTTEYTFVNRNTGRRITETEFSGAARPSYRTPRESDELDAEQDFPSDDMEYTPANHESTGKHKQPMRGIGFVLTVQTVLALLLILGAAAVRLIGGETAQKITAQYYQLTESGAIDLKALFTPIMPESDAVSNTGSLPQVSSQEPQAVVSGDSVSDASASVQQEESSQAEAPDTSGG